VRAGGRGGVPKKPSGTGRSGGRSAGFAGARLTAQHRRVDLRRGGALVHSGRRTTPANVRPHALVEVLEHHLGHHLDGGDADGQLDASAEQQRYYELSTVPVARQEIALATDRRCFSNHYPPTVPATAMLPPRSPAVNPRSAVPRQARYAGVHARTACDGAPSPCGPYDAAGRPRRGAAPPGRAAIAG